MEEALKWHLSALAIRQATLDPEHPTIAVSLGNAASIYFMLDQMDLALDLANEALTINRQSLGSEHPQTGVAAYELGYYYTRLERTNEALSLAREADQIFKSAYAVGHWHTGRNAMILGIGLLRSGETATGIAELESALDPTDDLSLGEMQVEVHLIVELLETANEPALANAYRERLDKAVNPM